jgi:hypothetical protein
MTIASLRNECAGIGLAREHVRLSGLEQHVIEGEAEADIHIAATFFVLLCAFRGRPCNHFVRTPARAVAT